MKWLLVALALCLNVQADQPVKTPEERKAEGVKKLKDNYYGGAYYRERGQGYRDEKDQWALGVLKSAGFTEAEAKAKMAAIRQDEASKPKPKPDPIFTRGEGLQRGSPSLDIRKKGAVKK